MKPVTFNAPHDSGRVYEIVGYPTGIPGLVVADGGPSCGHWIVCHVRSGLGVGTCVGDPELALRYARRLGAHADWTALTGRDVERLLATDADLRGVVIDMKVDGFACGRFHGRPNFGVDNGGAI